MPVAKEAPAASGCACATMIAVLRRPGGFERSEKPMDTQTIIAVCAVFTVVIGIVSLARRE